MSKLISVVVTAYNSETYLKICVDSILSQTYKDLEIILVDNGSTDGTYRMVEEYKSVDRRIKVVHKKHEGIPGGRKAGLEVATGEYFTIVDSDDYIDKDLYQSLMNNISDEDLITSGFRYISPKKTMEVFDNIPAGTYATAEEMNYIPKNMIWYDKKQMDFNGYGIQCYPWCKLFRKDLYKSVYETVDNFQGRWEDVISNFAYILKCKKIKITNICGYNYIIRNESSSHSFSPNYLLDLKRMYDSLHSVFKGHPQEKALIDQLEFYISDAILTGFDVGMGFSHSNMWNMYVLPYMNKLNDKAIAIYGASPVGCSYYSQMKALNKWKIAAWVSKNWQKYSGKDMEVSPVTKLLEVEYDYVIIAVSGQKMAEEIKLELVEMGIQKDKLLWEAPINMRTLLLGR